jgi:hypothetical protein
MLFSIIYFSKATNAMQDEDLILLLEESRNWNKTHGLSGMLIYIRGEQALNPKAGKFMQVLEGTKQEVKGIFEKIKLDKRHQDITILNEAIVKKRSFGSWLMGFEVIDSEFYKTMPGFFELDNSFPNGGKGQKLNMALNFLESFYTMQANPKLNKHLLLL